MLIIGKLFLLSLSNLPPAERLRKITSKGAGGKAQSAEGKLLLTMARTQAVTRNQFSDKKK